MFKRGIRFIVAGIIFAALAGCGGSNTNGTLGLSVTANALTGVSAWALQATATYTNSSVTDRQNTPIDLTWTFTDATGATVAAKRTVHLNSDASGVVTDNVTVPQGTNGTIVTVTASTGGLSTTQTASVPAITFTNTSTAQ